MDLMNSLFSISVMSLKNIDSKRLVFVLNDNSKAKRMVYMNDAFRKILNSYMLKRII